MRISEYKTALAQVDDHQMDRLFATLKGTIMHFERPRRPPKQWQKVVGAITHMPGPRAPKGNNHPTDSKFPRPIFLTLTKFFLDLQDEFGASIATDCINRLKQTGDTPLSARTVKNVIDNAEESRKFTQLENDARLTSYLGSVTWVGLVPPANPNLRTNRDHGIPDDNISEFVKTLIIDRCVASPDYDRRLLQHADFNDIALPVLQLYEEVLRLPGMTGSMLNTTFEMAYKNSRMEGIENVTQRLASYAATAYIHHNLDSDDPDSLMNKAVQAHDYDPPLPPLSDIFMTRIESALTARIAKATDEHEIAEEASIRIVFQILTELATQTLDSLLKEHYWLQHQIETSTVLTQRQKTMLHQSLDHGQLPRERLPFILRRAEWMNTQIAPRMTRLNDDRKGKSGNDVTDILTLLDDLASPSQEDINAFQAQYPKLRSDATLHSEITQWFCKTQMAFFAAGLSNNDAQILAEVLSSTPVNVFPEERFTQDKAAILLAYRTLKSALNRRQREVGDDIHALMAKTFDQTIRQIKSNHDNFVQTPSGLTVAQAFWEAVRDGILKLENDDNTAFIGFHGWDEGWQADAKDLTESYIDLEDWDNIDEATKLRRLDDGLQSIVNTVFDGDKGKAATFTRHIITFFPAILMAVTANEDLNPIKLGGEIPVSGFGTNRAKTIYKVTLLHVDNGHLTIRFELSSLGLRVATDMHNHRYWLDSKGSAISLSSLFTLSPNGRFTLQMPMTLSYRLELDDWPESAYPQPIPSDLYSPRRPVHGDLLNYVALKGNPSELALMLALDAVHRFKEHPSAEQALLVYHHFITAGNQANLEDFSAITCAIMQKLSDKEYDEIRLGQLNFLRNTLDIVLGTPSLAHHKDAALALRNHIDAFIASPTPDIFNRLLEELHTPDSPYAALKTVIPDAIELVLSGPPMNSSQVADASLVDALEKGLVNYIGDEVLPSFIESVRASATSTFANT